MKFFNYSRWLWTIRDKYEIENSKIGIRGWEILMLLVGGYLKEIINCLIVTFSGKTKNLTNVIVQYPFNQDLFWTLILKVLIAFILFEYFLFRLRESDSLNMWYVSIFLVWSMLSEIISVIGSNELLNVVWLLKIAFFIWFFFAKDGNNIDAIKLLFYEKKDLYRNNLAGKIYKSPNSKISYKKTEKTIFSIIFLTLAILLMGAFLIQMFRIIKCGWQRDCTATPKNQEIIENIRKHGSYSGIVVLVLSVLLKAPIVEELVFRKCIMDLGKNQLWVAIASGFFFSFMHLKSDRESMEVIINYIFHGVMLSMVKYWFRNIWFSIFSHGMLNCFALIGMFYK